jgi:IS5 family transposase
MQRQGSFSQAEYAGKKRQTRRDRFSAEMEEVVPWARLVDRLRSFYPKGERGRPPVGLERMLRIYFFAAVVRAGRRGPGGRAVRQPGAVRLCRRRSVGGDSSGRDEGAELPPLARAARLDPSSVRRGRCNAGGARLVDAPRTIVDATIIAAPPSTKNKSKARDRKMHQTKKGNQWYFGMKAHVGVDSPPSSLTRWWQPRPGDPFSNSRNERANPLSLSPLA